MYSGGLILVTNRRKLAYRMRMNLTLIWSPWLLRFHLYLSSLKICSIRPSPFKIRTLLPLAIAWCLPAKTNLKLFITFWVNSHFIFSQLWFVSKCGNFVAKIINQLIKLNQGKGYCYVKIDWMYVNLYFGRCYALEVMNFKTLGLYCWLFLSNRRWSVALMRAHARSKY